MIFAFIRLYQAKRFSKNIILLSIVLWFGREDRAKKLEHIDGMEVKTVAEKMPEYKGGLEEYLRLIMKNFKYPKSQPEFQASVYVGFVIDTLGHVRNECVIRRFSESEIHHLKMKY